MLHFIVIVVDLHILVHHLESDPEASVVEGELHGVGHVLFHLLVGQFLVILVILVGVAESLEVVDVPRSGISVEQDVRLFPLVGDDQVEGVPLEPGLGHGLVQLVQNALGVQMYVLPQVQAFN